MHNAGAESPSDLSTDNMRDQTTHGGHLSPRLLLCLLAITTTAGMFWAFQQWSEERAVAIAFPAQVTVSVPEELGKVAGFPRMDFVRVPSGTFTMGSCPNDFEGKFLPPEQWQRLVQGCSQAELRLSKGQQLEAPRKKVTISQEFEVSRREVTVEDYYSFLNDRKMQPSSKFLMINFKPQAPVRGLSYDDAESYVSWLNQTRISTDRYQYALPSAEQWEYACLLGQKNADHSAWRGVYDLQTEGPLAVGSLKPDANGIYDMLGNVSEWTSSLLESHVKNNTFGIVKGGSWQSTKRAMRCQMLIPNYRSSPIQTVGLRLIRYQIR